MGASCQSNIHLAHKARHSTCLTCGLMALPEGRGEEAEGRERGGEGEWRGEGGEGEGEGRGGGRRDGEGRGSGGRGGEMGEGGMRREKGRQFM